MDPLPQQTSALSEEDLIALEAARNRLENPSLAIRLSSSLGVPIETVIRQIGASVPAPLASAARDSARKAVEVVFANALKTLRETEAPRAHPGLHKLAATTTGAVSGFVGLHALIVELPITTGIMFRSILDIARAEGESPKNHETLLNAMQIFAMGSGRSDKDDAAETSYYGVRLALSKTLSDALQSIAARGLGQAGEPALFRFVTAIANRFGLVVTQKAMAQTIPIVGAVGGGLVNTVFISHFQDMARGHFTIRRLERTYGADRVQEAYRALAERDLAADRKRS